MLTSWLIVTLEDLPAWEAKIIILRTFRKRRFTFCSWSFSISGSFQSIICVIHSNDAPVGSTNIWQTFHFRLNNQHSVSTQRWEVRHHKLTELVRECKLGRNISRHRIRRQKKNRYSPKKHAHSFPHFSPCLCLHQGLTYQSFPALETFHNASNYATVRIATRQKKAQLNKHRATGSWRSCMMGFR